MREARLRDWVEALFGRPERSFGEARRRGVRAAIVRGSLVVVAGGSAAAVGLAGVASAEVVCGSTGTPSTAGTTAACAYTASGQDTFTVPAGVTSVDVTAVGAGGGIGANSTELPGLGASVQDAAVPVTAGQVLGVVVGGPGTPGAQSTGGPGGSPGGGGAGGDDPTPDPSSSGGGGGGGGYSGLLDPAQNPLVIAGAGGGSGGDNGRFGGAGDTGQGGGAGGNGNLSTGGGGGTSTGGGSGGVGGFPGGGAGTAGSFLRGGQGGAADGFGSAGGGGGGYYGGGGGGGSDNASGGGGGSSFGVTGLSNEATSAVPASVTIRYTVASPPTCQPVAASTAVGQPVSVQLDCADSTGASLTYAIDSAPSHGSLGSIDQSTGRATYTPSSGYTGRDSFTYHATSSNGSSQTATVSITVTANLADVSAAITGPARAASGSTFTETITVANAGPAAATDVITGLIVPSGLTATNTGGGHISHSVVSWTARSLAPYAAVTYPVTFKVAANVHRRVLIGVVSASTHVNDPRYANNAAATFVTLG
jgi:uncharacterized repeat protein (TIGR01451 family)